LFTKNDFQLVQKKEKEQMEFLTGAERRAEVRNSLTHEFVVSHPNLGEVNCFTDDISLHGAFLLGRFSGLSVGSTVELSFIKHSRRQDVDKGTRYRFHGTVMRIVDNGAGVRFQGLTTEVDAALYDLMHQ
jgi:hypothetical protein